MLAPWRGQSLRSMLKMVHSWAKFDIMAYRKILPSAGQILTNSFILAKFLATAGGNPRNITGKNTSVFMSQWK